MFSHQGAERSEQQNRIVAGYLAVVGGYVNACGFVLVGTFTSHMSGVVGRFAYDLTSHQIAAAGAALTMLLAFFAGAFVASMMIESDIFVRRSRAYALALLTEALLLTAFALIAHLTRDQASPRLRDAEAALLCAAMGSQNSLVTRLSGAVVRTTHVTGVFTDLGIECARWFRWSRGRLSSTLHVKLALGSRAPELPNLAKLTLLATIAASFTVGALVGGVLVLRDQHRALALPTIAVLVAAVYAYLNEANPTPQQRR